ncbi:MAG: hypothetical protein OEY63_07575 [Gemmatimonadota bacterium]|nr:hypothetical protein [Gemmatimonadota bacterium]
MNGIRKAVGLPAAFSLIILAVLGCGPEAGRLELSATLDGMPLQNLTITVVPYDLDQVTETLDRRAATPKPAFGDLETELFDYEPGSGEPFREVFEDWSRARRSVSNLADSLNGLDREAEGYRAAYQRFRAAYAALATREAQLQRRLEEALSTDRDLVSRASEAADSLRTWESEAYSAFDSVATVTSGRRSISGISGLTDEMGALNLEPAAGASWIVARTPHPTNPFLEYSWNVPVGISVFVKVRAHLSSGNVTLRWRR